MSEIFDSETVFFANNVGNPITSFTVFINELGADRVDGRNFLEIIRRQVNVLKSLFWVTTVDPRYSEEMLDFFRKPNASTTVGRDVDAWNFKCTGKLRSCQKKFVFLWAK